MGRATLLADKPLKVKLEEVESNKATMVFSDGQKFSVNAKFLPGGVRPGDMLYLDLMTSEQYNKTKEEVAREVLKEILGTEDGGEGKEKKEG